MKLREITRRQLATLNRTDKKRFMKRSQYHPTTYQGVNIKEFFENDKLIFTTKVNNYEVIFSFTGPLTELKRILKSTNKTCTLRDVIRALLISIDKSDDVRVRCSCDDFTYRFAYWASKNEYIYGQTQETPPKYTRTNKDGKGGTCKHIGLMISNKNWLVKVASVINNYIRLYVDDTYDYIYDKSPMDDPERAEPEVTNDPNNNRDIEVLDNKGDATSGEEENSQSD